MINWKLDVWLKQKTNREIEMSELPLDKNYKRLLFTVKSVHPRAPPSSQSPHSPLHPPYIYKIYIQTYKHTYVHIYIIKWVNKMYLFHWRNSKNYVRNSNSKQNVRFISFYLHITSVSMQCNFSTNQIHLFWGLKTGEFLLDLSKWTGGRLKKINIWKKWKLQ